MPKVHTTTLVILFLNLLFFEATLIFFLFLEQGRDIQPLPCQDKNEQIGVCMYTWNCAEIGGSYLGHCIDGVQFGSCCKLPEKVLDSSQNLQQAPENSGSEKFQAPEIKLSNQIKVIGTLQSELKDDLSVLFSLGRTLPQA